MTAAARTKLMACVALTCASVAYTQAPLDPASIDTAVANLEVGQSLTQGNSKLTLNQRATGTKDEKGWFTATSSRGGFAVRFPAPINDLTYSVVAEGGVQIEENMLTSETATTRFMVMCMKQAAFPVSAEIIDRTVGMVESQSHQFKSEHFKNGSMAGLQYSGIDAAGLYFAGQTFVMAKQICQFMVGSPDAFQGIPPDARTAFDSFRTVSGVNK